jgi:hypothetical protein
MQSVLVQLRIAAYFSPDGIVMDITVLNKGGETL